MSPNAFESGERKVVPAVLIYVRSGDHVLMIHRTGKKGDYHSGKWNGLGGKFEADESPLECARRELREESGLDLEEPQFHCLGVIQFPNFKAHKHEDWLVYVFSARIEERVSSLKCSEGDLHWVPSTDLLQLNLWPGDRHFLPYVLEERPFLGTIWYRGEEVLRHQIQPLIGR